MDSEKMIITMLEQLQLDVNALKRASETTNGTSISIGKQIMMNQSTLEDKINSLNKNDYSLLR